MRDKSGNERIGISKAVSTTNTESEKLKSNKTPDIACNTGKAIAEKRIKEIKLIKLYFKINKILAIVELNIDSLENPDL
jgi:hypothetical protein